MSPLADGTYRRLFGAQIIALAGTGLTTIALALLAYELAGGEAGKVLGTALAIKMVAYIGVAPVIGGLAHHLPRRALLVALDIARACIVGFLPFVTEVWQIYLLIFLLNACSAGFTPTFQATIPDILRDDAQYTKALSYSRLAYDLENLLSPTLAAAALFFFTFDALFAANAAAFVVSASLILSVRLPRATPPDRGRGVWQNVSFGTAAYLKTPRLRGLLALSLAVASAGAMIIVNTVVYVRDILGGSESDTALVLAGAGAGSMIAAMLIPRLIERVPDRAVMIGGGFLLATGLASGLALGMTAPGMIGLTLIWFLLGCGSSLIQTPAGRLLRRSAHDGDRPAIFAAQFALSHGCWLIGYLSAGFLGGAFGLGAAFTVLSALALLSTATALWLWPAEDPMELAHTHEAVAHEHRHFHDAHHQHAHEGWEGPEPHSHPHRHEATRHKHAFVIDTHHRHWPA
ncbi:MFS transporter [Hwanghaeella sp.]|uniref:MFS transporter n=1 Tax=Hwanghaeella sp. TaxID=2605943 RepID=UPI003CCB7EFE